MNLSYVLYMVNKDTYNNRKHFIQRVANILLKVILTTTVS